MFPRFERYIIPTTPFVEGDGKTALERLQKPIVQINMRPTERFNVIHAHIFSLLKQISEYSGSIAVVVFDITASQRPKAISRDSHIPEFIKNVVCYLERIGADTTTLKFSSESMIYGEKDPRDVYRRLQSLVQVLEVNAGKGNVNFASVFDVFQSFVYESYIQPDVLLTGAYEGEIKSKMRGLATINQSLEWFHNPIVLYIPTVPNLRGKNEVASETEKTINLSDTDQQIIQKIHEAHADFLIWICQHFLSLNFTLISEPISLNRADFDAASADIDRSQVAKALCSVFRAFRENK